MFYGKNYLDATKAADQIIDMVRQGAQKRSSSGLMTRQKIKETGEQSIKDMREVQLEYLMDIRQSFEELELPKEEEPLSEIGLEKKYTADGQLRPQARSDVVPENIKADPAFMEQIKRLSEKFNISEDEIFRVIQGESSFNPKARNKSGATGLFQFMPATAAELGFTTDDIYDMAPAEQAKVYEKYLDRWKYNGQVPLAVMQGAPAYANKPLNTVVYKKGSAAWEQNPGWRPADGGDITLESMTNYYRGK